MLYKTYSILKNRIDAITIPESLSNARKSGASRTALLLCNDSKNRFVSW